MFYPIEGGSVIEINDNAFGFVYKCNLPPFGKGKNVATGAIQDVDVFDYSEVPEENYWRRPTLPLDYNVRRKKEREVQQIDPYYFDPYLQDIRKTEWRRRLCGVWFKNYNPIKEEVEWIYLTGLNYLYITWWKFQGKFMDFRISDRDWHYVNAYCMEDPDCLGGNEQTKRKSGKTARVGCWAYERVSRLSNHHAGLQSKTDDDAEEAYLKAIVHPWQKLPDFFRPRYDQMKPNEISFFATARRGSKAEEEDNIAEEPLESFFDYKPSSEAAYDGPQLETYVSDEAGKTKKPVSIIERQNVTRYCSEIDGVMIGKQWYTTTVEPEKGEPENYEFQEMTANSNPLERDENNRTGTGLYTYFLPAQEGMYRNPHYAKYGYPDVKSNLEFLNNTIRSYEEKGDTRGLSSFKRKNPRNFKEAFSADGETALYDPELLNNQLDEISWTTHLTERGDLEWVDGYSVKRPVGVDANGKMTYAPNKVKWVPNINGKYEKVAGWEPREPNNVFERYGRYVPNNNHLMRIGCDPFKYDKTKDKRRSNCAAFGYQIADEFYPTDYDDTFVIRYAMREESTAKANMSVLKMAWYCGCEVLFERNINHWEKDFETWECYDFLMWMPGELMPGVITAGNAVQTICNYTEAYINKHIKKVFFKTLIRKDTGWLGFKVEDTEKYDECMGAGITLVAVKGKTYPNSREKLPHVSSFFKKYKN